MKKATLQELPVGQQQLVRQAIEARQRAYAPYSGFKVGAALQDERDAIHVSCNVEGADYTLTTHAEMGAINSMVRSGVLRVRIMAVAVQAKAGYAMPCGLCRQKIREFSSGPEVVVLGINLDEKEAVREIYVSTLGELLPYSFGAEHL